MKIDSTSKSFIYVIMLVLISLLYVMGLNVYFTVAVTVFLVHFFAKSFYVMKEYFREIVYRRNGESTLYLTEFTVCTLIWCIDLVGLMIVLTMLQFDLFPNVYWASGLQAIYLPFGFLYAFIVGLPNFVTYRDIAMDLKDRLFKSIRKDK